MLSSSLPPIAKHLIILLDIDRTLVFSRKYGNAEMITYTGDYQTWFTELTNFARVARTEGVLVHYGLATLKSAQSFKEQPNLRGDNVYGQIMGDLEWSKYTKCCYSHTLKKLIDEKLIFFLGEKLEELSAKVTPKQRQALADGGSNPDIVSLGDKFYLLRDFFECKATYAMEEARKIIEERYSTHISPEQVILIDDSKTICSSTANRNFGCICVHNLQDADTKVQKQVISKIFTELLPTQLNEIYSPKSATDNLQLANRQILEILKAKPLDVKGEATGMVFAMKTSGSIDGIQFFKTKTEVGDEKTVQMTVKKETAETDEKEKTPSVRFAPGIN